MSTAPGRKSEDTTEQASFTKQRQVSGRVTNWLHTMDTAQTKPHRHKVPASTGWPHTRSEYDSGPAFARFSTKAQCANNIFKLHSLALVCHARKLDVGVQPQFTSTDFLVCEQPFTVCGIGTSRQTRKR